MTYKEAKVAKEKMMPCFFEDDDGESHEVFIESVGNDRECIIVGSGVGRIRVNVSELSKEE